MRLLIALVVWAAAAAAAAGLSSVVAGSIHSSTTTTAHADTGPGSDTGPTSGTSTGESQAPFDASAVKPTDSLSLFRTTNFARALASARSQLGAHAELELLALYPGYVSITGVSAGKHFDFYVDAEGGSRSVSIGGNPGGSATFPISRVGADVPAALAHRIASAAHIPESQLRYMVAEIDPTTPRVRWLVYTNPGSSVEYFEASGATGQLFEYRSGSSAGLRPLRG